MITNVRLLHVADLHLGNLISVPSPNSVDLKVKTKDYALDRIVRLASKWKPQIVLIAGDVFHTPFPSLSVVLMFQKMLFSLVELGAEVFISPGNHDPWVSNSVWDNWVKIKGVYVFCPQPGGVELVNLGVWVAGVAHDSKFVKKNLSSLLPVSPNNLVGIACVHADPVLYEKNMGEIYAPVDKNTFLNSNFIYWALGHQHKAREFFFKPKVVMAGTNQGSHFGENSPHGVWLVEINLLERNVIKCDFVENAPLVFYDFVLDDLLNVDNFFILFDMISAVLDSQRQVIDHDICLKVSLEGICPLWKELTEEGLRECSLFLKDKLGVSFFKLNTSSLIPPVNIERLLFRKDILGSLLKLLNRVEDDSVFLAVLEKDIRMELHPWILDWDIEKRKKWLNSLIKDVRGIILRDFWLGDRGL